MAKRRKILTALGGLLIGSSAWYKKDTIVTGGLQITDTKSKTTTLGGIIITATVQNLNPVGSSSGKIVTRVTYEDGSAIRETKSINKLQSLSSRDYSVQINPGIEERLQGDNYEYDVWLENN